MNRAIAALVVLAACNQREGAKPPPPAPASAVAVHETPPPPPAPPQIAVAPPPDAAPPGARAKAHADHDDDVVRLQEDDAKAMADLLTADVGSGTSDLDSKRRPGADLGQQINDVRDSGAVVAVGGGARANGSGMSGAAGSAGAVAAKDDGPRGRITIADKKELDESSLTADMVLAKVMAVYMAGLHRCYRDALHGDPTERGKMIVSFTVNETGRTVRATVNGFDDQVDACATTLMAGWRFAVPKDKDGEATEAGFQLTFQLVPD